MFFIFVVILIYYSIFKSLSALMWHHLWAKLHSLTFSPSGDDKLKQKLFGKKEKAKLTTIIVLFALVVDFLLKFCENGDGRPG